MLVEITNEYQNLLKKNIINKTIASSVLSSIKDPKTYEEYDLTIKILFLLFEKTQNCEKTREKISDKLCSVIKSNEFSNDAESLMNHLTVMLSKASLVCPLSYLIKKVTSLKIINIEDVVKVFIEQCNSHDIARNCAQILEGVCVSVRIAIFESLSDNEYYILRICYLEILVNKVLNCKIKVDKNHGNVLEERDNSSESEENPMEENVYIIDPDTMHVNSISDLIFFTNHILNILNERLLDLNFYVRSRVIHLLGVLHNASLLKNIESMFFIAENVLDKTVNVRKKSICFFSNYLMKRNIKLLNNHECNNCSELKKSLYQSSKNTIQQSVQPIMEQTTTETVKSKIVDNRNTQSNEFEEENSNIYKTELECKIIEIKKIIQTNLCKVDDQGKTENNSNFTHLAYLNCDFVIDLILQQVISNCLTLLTSNITTESLEIIHFIKLAYYYSVNGSIFAMYKMFDLVWDKKTKPILLGSIKEIIQRQPAIDFFYSFLPDEYEQNQSESEMYLPVIPSESFCRLISLFRFKKLWTDKLKQDFFNNEPKASFILSNVRNLYFDCNFLLFASRNVFKSENEFELNLSMMIYRNILKMILNSTIRKCSCDKQHNNSIDKVDIIDNNCSVCTIQNEGIIKCINLVSKNITKFNFFCSNTIELTISILIKFKAYIQINDLIQVLSSKQETLKIVYVIGSCALAMIRFYDQVEQKVKKNRTLSIRLSEKVRNRTSFKLSLRRNSCNNTFYDQTFMEDDLSIQEWEKAKISEDVTEYFNNLKSQIGNDESVFHKGIQIAKNIIREHDSYNDEYEINQKLENTYLSSIDEGIEPKDKNKNNIPQDKSISGVEYEDYVNIAYNTLFRVMLSGSEVFLRNKLYLGMALKSKYLKVRNTAIFALCDFVVIYSAWVEDYLPNLFYFLQEKNIFNINLEEENMIIYMFYNNCLLNIYHLLKCDMLKLKGNFHVFPPLLNTNFAPIVLRIFEALNENQMASVVYEYVLYGNMNDEKIKIVKYLLPYVKKAKIRIQLWTKLKEKISKAFVESLQDVFSKIKDEGPENDIENPAIVD